MYINIANIDVIILDFDGVLTDNYVYIDENGAESVRCSRGDGLAFDVLRKLNKPVYILSTEKNKVVNERAKKLNIKSFNGVNNKAKALSALVKENDYLLDKTVYVGNDVNDYLAMSLCGYSICPADSHKDIKDISTIILKSSGGNGVVREILEDVMNLNFINILFRL
jgi:YrbI family 3-deoxy-D-manno-octulosonate 8-phosphate phosphatase